MPSVLVNLHHWLAATGNGLCRPTDCISPLVRGMQVDTINEKFAEAREEIEYAREDAETVSSVASGPPGQ